MKSTSRPCSGHVCLRAGKLGAPDQRQKALFGLGAGERGALVTLDEAAERWGAVAGEWRATTEKQFALARQAPALSLRDRPLQLTRRGPRRQVERGARRRGDRDELQGPTSSR
jgi:hypothetical protein